MPANHSCDLVNATYVWRVPPLSRRAVMPFPGAPSAPTRRPAVTVDPSVKVRPTRADVGLVEQHRAVPVEHARSLAAGADRSAFLDTVSTAWEALDPDDYPFTRAVAKQVRDHDDRAEFLAGVDIILTGITTVHAAPG
jgi:hypothetical protein